jgi:hypothetical protein
MIMHYRDRDGNVLDRAWKAVELEAVARLMAWGVPRIVIESIVGWSAVEPTAAERARMGRIMANEKRLIRRL